MRKSVFRRWLERRSDGDSLLNPKQWLLDLFGVSNTSSGERITNDKALLNSNVYTCASILGGDIGKLPLQVFKRRGMALRKTTPIPSLVYLGCGRILI